MQTTNQNPTGIIASFDNNKNQLMSSKRIAEKTGKDHSHVLRDIRNMLTELELSHHPKTDHPDYQIINDQRNYISEILLNERLSLCLAAGYSVVLRMMIIDDWAELKKTRTPQTYIEALKALVAAEEEKERIALQLKQSETKVENLNVALDNLLSWVSIIKVATHNNVSERKFNWRVLKNQSERMGITIKRAASPRYGYQNLYHVDVFRVCYPGYDYNFDKVKQQVSVL